MPWWLRLIWTLILAPVLWLLGVVFIAANQGGAGDSATLARGFGDVALLYTLPALVLVGGVLLPVDLLLRRLGIGLLSPIVSPLVAWGVARLVLAFVNEPHVQAAAGAVSLFVVYGFIWGMTTREPRFGGAALPSESAP